MHTHLRNGSSTRLTHVQSSNNDKGENEKKKMAIFYRFTVDKRIYTLSLTHCRYKKMLSKYNNIQIEKIQINGYFQILFIHEL